MTTTHGSHGRARFRLNEPRLADLPSAIEWLREHWDGQREAPVRLHEAHTTDGALGGLRYSGAFTATLGWSSRTSVRTTMTQRCSHPMNGGRERDCPECMGVGIKDVTVDRYPHPMSTALEELRRSKGRQGQIPAIAIVVTLASFGYSVRTTVQVLHLPDESVILGAIRQLVGKYQAGPVASVGWTDKSQSQQMAEGEALAPVA